MGDTTDGSSSAAQSAQPETPENTSERGFFGRIVEALSPSDTSEELTPKAEFVPASEARGMINLRRMRVEDVMVPKADIVAVPVA